MNADCLVLKIEEYVDELLDTTLFILYDKNEEIFLVKGKRSVVFGKPEPISYSFTCEFASELIDFIEFVISKESKVSYSLYNYNDLPNDSKDIDYDYLKHRLESTFKEELIATILHPSNYNKFKYYDL